MHEPKVQGISVIIPVYNVSACIERCIQSVMNQTYTDFECILVDDCGTDDSNRSGDGSDHF